MDGAAIGNSIVPASHPCMDVVPSPATIPDAPELQAAFWTSCANCRVGLEYSMEYKQCLIRCPGCKKLFKGEEQTLESIIEQIGRSVLHAPNHGVAGASTVPASHPTMDIVPTLAVDVNPVAIPVALQMQTAFWTSCGFCGWQLEYPMKYENCLLCCPHCKNPFKAKEKPRKSVIEMPPVPLWIQASPDVVIAELTKIPELSPMDSPIDWLNAFNMLRYNDFQLRSLKALPMDMRKAWLLNQIK